MTWKSHLNEVIFEPFTHVQFCTLKMVKCCLGLNTNKYITVFFFLMPLIFAFILDIHTHVCFQLHIYLSQRQILTYTYKIQSCFLHLYQECLYVLPFSGLDVEEITHSLILEASISKSLKASMDLLKIPKNFSGVNCLGSGLLDDFFTFQKKKEKKNTRLGFSNSLQI